MSCSGLSNSLFSGKPLVLRLSFIIYIMEAIKPDPIPKDPDSITAWILGIFFSVQWVILRIKCTKSRGMAPGAKIQFSHSSFPFSFGASFPDTVVYFYSRPLIAPCTSVCMCLRTSKFTPFYRNVLCVLYSCV